MGTGSEVQLCVKAQEILEKEGVMARVVSFPSWELFEAQSAAYKEEVLPSSIKARVAVEAACSFGWQKWTGDFGKFVTLERFGASAPGNVALKNLGFTPEKVAEAAKASLKPRPSRARSLIQLSFTSPREEFFAPGAFYFKDHSRPPLAHLSNFLKVGGRRGVFIYNFETPFESPSAKLPR